MHPNDITEKIIGRAYNVANELGSGFLEKVYENAMMVELKKAGLKVTQQCPVNVFYGGVNVGEYFVDLFVENEVIVELKVASRIDNTHQAQLMNYLKACQKPVGLLLNFGSSRVELKRMVNNFEEN